MSFEEASAPPDGGFVLQWINADLSAQRLGWPETIRFIEGKLSTCHPRNRSPVRADLEAAREASGRTLFEIIIDIIRAHGPGGAEARDNVHLVIA